MEGQSTTKSTVVATFNSTTGWAGKAIVYQAGEFLLEDHGAISARNVLEYDDRGQIDWAYAGLKEWVVKLASGPLPLASAPQASPTDSRLAASEEMPHAVVIDHGAVSHVTTMSDAPGGHTAPTSALRCPSCGAELAGDFRFCPFCASLVAEPQESATVALPVGGAGSTGAPTAVSQPAVVVEPDAPPSDGITIEFPHSTSQSFDFAVRAAQALPGFHQYGEGKKALYRVTVPAESVASSFELLEQLKGWRRRTVYVNGEKAPWDSVFAFQWCYEKRLGSYKPDFYCYGYENEYQFNLWGCIQAGLPFTERAEWFAWGRWLSKEGDWQFDKKRIQHELEKRLFHERFCPALQFDLVGQMLEALPDSVNPRRDSNWKFMESWNDGTPGGLKMRISRFGIEETVLMKGVCPNGQGGIAEIGKRLARIGLRLPPPS